VPARHEAKALSSKALLNCSAGKVLPTDTPELIRQTYTMVGHFFYSSEITERCVFVNMRWSGSKPEGVLHIPSSITEQVERTEYDQFATGDVFHLPIALGIAVTLSILTFTPMFLTGDRSVWTEEWGRLERRLVH
jgi:hypothetical protein